MAVCFSTHPYFVYHGIVGCKVKSLLHDAWLADSTALPETLPKSL